jgi:hypothetical protein
MQPPETVGLQLRSQAASAAGPDSTNTATANAANALERLVRLRISITVPLSLAVHCRFSNWRKMAR